MLSNSALTDFKFGGKSLDPPGLGFALAVRDTERHSHRAAPGKACYGHALSFTNIEFAKFMYILHVQLN